jgi:hypothetical protein
MSTPLSKTRLYAIGHKSQQTLNPHDAGRPEASFAPPLFFPLAVVVAEIAIGLLGKLDLGALAGSIALSSQPAVGKIFT